MNENHSRSRLNQTYETYLVVIAILGGPGGSPVVVGVQVTGLVAVPSVLVEVGLVAGAVGRLRARRSARIVVGLGIPAAVLLLGGGHGQEKAHQVRGKEAS